jgi:hypothetical protein
VFISQFREGCNRQYPRASVLTTGQPFQLATGDEFPSDLHFDAAAIAMVFRHKTFIAECDGHANTLTLLRDTHRNIIGGFTPS